ncbi:MAG: DUF3090 family protein [Actinomycetales bacterium]|nr:DUF3090 family protein [Actinomycetales bacterium]
MIFEFENVDRFICGTVGEPGEREFYLQVRSGSTIVSASLEKAQAAALAQRLDILCKEVVKQDPTLIIDRLESDDAPLEMPVDREFVIGALSVAWKNEAKKVCVELYSIKEVDIEDDTPEISLNITFRQAKAFISRTHAVVNAGRIPCPFCAIPIDPRGHLCPRANGYRR